MVFINLFFAFFRIGLFSFGGGLAMIPMYLTEVEKHGWMTQSEFMDIVAVSQMTPGPIAVNMASYVGSGAAGWPGAIVATTALALPSVLVILALTTVLNRLKNNPRKDAFFFGIKSAAMALIFYAGWLIASDTLTTSLHDGQWPMAVKGLLIAGGCYLTRVYWSKLEPVLLILASGVVGAFIFSGQ
ncbi:hypothetical protein GZ77_01255 [Endozoicomonas montiporae]|uniref:Chromate transporter n=1 Tax=Endozoicomonas montiporae TaxID=1027273 RepID=A0A081NA42_9GAMM|nr:chromate transporter [Endozoicomonas montiporae]KEQ15315.1 hypothetical protein GZ77_01255 [Endozoicomonas montiporae]